MTASASAGCSVSSSMRASVVRAETSSFADAEPGRVDEGQVRQPAGRPAHRDPVDGFGFQRSEIDPERPVGAPERQLDGRAGGQLGGDRVAERMAVPGDDLRALARHRWRRGARRQRVQERRLAGLRCGPRWRPAAGRRGAGARPPPPVRGPSPPPGHASRRRCAGWHPRGIPDRSTCSRPISPAGRRNCRCSGRPSGRGGRTGCTSGSPCWGDRSACSP